MSENVENEGSGSASGELAELTRPAAFAKQSGAVLDDVRRRRVAKGNWILEEFVQAAEATSDNGTELSDVDRQVLASQKLNALSEALLFARSGRRYRRLRLGRKEVPQASKGAPKYPHVVV